MLTAIMLFTAACNVYLLLQLRRSTRLLEASHASLLAAVSRLQARQVAVEKVVIDRVFGKECVQILGVGIESSCCDSDYSEYRQHEKGPGGRYQRTHPAPAGGTS